MRVAAAPQKPDVHTWQTPFEHDHMLLVFNALEPARVLEIGVWEGGTLWHWLQVADTVVAVDDAMKDPAAWKEWAAEADCTLELLEGYSQDKQIVADARDLGPYGFVLIDGDHGYDNASQDWQNYSPMVEPGGVLCFHDIMGDPSDGVPRLWREIKGTSGSRTVEVIGDLPSRGIGMVWL